MARSISSGQFRSKAERTVNENMKQELGNEWWMIHSLSIMESQTKKNSEIDLMLVGPRGVFCLEIKGGTFKVMADGKYQVSYDGRTTLLRESPFDQAKEAFYSIKRYIEKVVPGVYEDCATGWGVVVPETIFDPENAPTYIREATFDARDYDILDPYRAFVKRLADYWVGRMLKKGKRPRDLTKEEVERIKDEMLAIGMVTPNRKLQAQLWQTEKDIDELTKTQACYLKKTIALPRMIISGGAGTGKTVLAQEVCRIKAREGKKVLYLCFNRALAENVSRHLAETCEKSIDAMSFHSFLMRTIKAAGMEDRIDRTVVGSSLYNSVLPRIFLEAAQSLGEGWKYDVLVVDESQDLLWPYNQGPLEATIKGRFDAGSWYFFLDPFQRLYGEDNSIMMSVLRKSSVHEYALDENCRNTIPIGREYRALADLNIADLLKIDGAETTSAYYANENEMMARLWEGIAAAIKQGVAPEMMVVLTKVQDIWGAVRSTRPAGLDLELLSPEQGERKGAARISTYRLFKGLEAPVVFLAGVDDIQEDSDFIYVGGSRAKSKLVILLDQSQRGKAETQRSKYAQPTTGAGR